MSFALVIGPDKQQVNTVVGQAEHVLQKLVPEIATVQGIVSELQVATHDGNSDVVLVTVLHQELLKGKEEEVLKAITGEFPPYTVFATVVSSLPWATGGNIM